MSDWPIWNYWMYDDNGEFVYKYAHTMDGHPDSEFLEGTEYEDEWAHKFFWTAEEATALSFGRSPTMVPYEDIEDMDCSSEFATHFCDLREKILSAQRDGVLTSPKIPTRMYVEWAEANRLPFPPSLAQQAMSFFDAVMNQTEENIKKLRTIAAQADETASTEDEMSGPELRRHHTLLGLVYALAWSHHRLGELTPNAVAERITGVVDQLRTLKSSKVEGNVKTVSNYLKEALDYFGPPPKKGAVIARQ